MILSIVLPMYGVEKYIEKSLLSCINQGAIRLGKDYEIICVNDGSPDKSAEIARDIAKGHEGIYVIDQENQGLSGARNTGLDGAHGEYVWFIDSDDWIDNDCLAYLWNDLSNNLDMLHIQHRLTYDDREPTPIAPCMIDGIVSGCQQTIAGGLDTPAQFTIYRRDFLLKNGLRFMKGILHEDCEFKPRALLLAERVASSPLVCYNYYQRSSGNIMSSFSIKHVYDFMTVLNSLYDAVLPYPSAVKKGVYLKISMWLNEILVGYWRLNHTDRDAVVKLLRNNRHIFKAATMTGNPKYVIEGYALLLSVKMGLNLYKLFKSKAG